MTFQGAKIMRICKPNEAGLIIGQGSPSMSNWSGFVMPAPAPAPPQPLFQAASTSSVGFLDPTITPSTPNTNTTVSITNDSSTGWISTTVTMPSSTTATTNPTVASSMPSTMNPTSNAQPSTPDVENAGLRTGDLALGVFGVNSAVTALGGPVGRAVVIPPQIKNS